KRPLNLEPGNWEIYIENRKEGEDPATDALFEREIERQLDERLTAKKPATIAILRSIADPAIARLETIAAGHQQRAEADPQQAPRLSFDASTGGERLHRYQFACSRSLFRSLDTLIKLRRSGLSSAGGKRTEENVSSNGDASAPVVCPQTPREPQAIGG